MHDRWLWCNGYGKKTSVSMRIDKQFRMAMDFSQHLVPVVCCVSILQPKIGQVGMLLVSSFRSSLVPSKTMSKDL